MGLGLIVIVILVILVAWALSGSRFGGASDLRRSPSETPLDIVKRRYAAGEISEEEFEQIKKDLQG